MRAAAAASTARPPPRRQRAFVPTSSLKPPQQPPQPHAECNYEIAFPFPLLPLRRRRLKEGPATTTTTTSSSSSHHQINFNGWLRRRRQKEEESTASQPLLLSSYLSGPRQLCHDAPMGPAAVDANLRSFVRYDAFLQQQPSSVFCSSRSGGNCAWSSSSLQNNPFLLQSLRGPLSEM